MNHISRFRLLYLQAGVAIASAVAGEFGPMKDLTHQQLADLTWVVWIALAANIIINAGNVIVASLNHPATALPTTTNSSVGPKSDHPLAASALTASPSQTIP